MRYVAGRACWSLVVAACLTVPAAGLEDFVEVSVVGEGISKDVARHDALRKALEQGGGIEISSRSNVDNYELIRDTVYARADGIVTDYRILDQGEMAGGTWYCKIIARVSKIAIASTWGEVQNVLDQIGRPGIAVYIQERIDGIIQDSSILESQIEHRLLDAGFVVHSGEQLRAVAEKESADAASEQNVARMQAIARDFGAQIFITGNAQADSAGVRTLAGQSTAMYNGDAMIKMYYTDTAELLASESLANWRGGARGHHTLSPQAGKKALENAGGELVERCYQNVMKRWATRVSGGGELTLEVEGMSLVDAIKLKKKLKAIDPDKIRNVDYSMTKGIARFRIKAKMTAEALAEHLVEDQFADLIEIVDLKTNRIQAKRVGN
ncbi:MAG: hypothetical protein JSU86_10330 [Phycisphaerales bacterium]|nr:MAG: hypothetical protein JSU86_10330 [Phycisphaerales bacterium]